jgi:hypothetical protein
MSHRVPTLMILAALACAQLAIPAGAAVLPPLPDDDPFYSVPANVGSHANGAILGSRTVTAVAFSVPLPAKAWQVKYKTTDNQGKPTATVTTILVPFTPWLGAGRRPLVSYQTAEDGVGTKCSPSYALRAGAAAAGSNSELETPLIATALQNGWAVAAPDYEGPNSAFLGGTGEGQAVLDGVRAAQHFSPAGLSPATPTGLWGYSGGSFATAAAAQLAGSYAPELSFKGVALGGLVADINATTQAFSGTVLGGALIVGIIGMRRANPDFDFDAYLNDRARAHIANSQTDCVNDAALKYPFLSIADLEAFPGALQRPEVQALMRANSPAGIPGTPTAPVYDYHSAFDEFAPLTDDRRLMTRYCAAGAVVQHVEHLASDHITETVTGAPGAMAFLNARFHGRPPTDTCATIPAS